MIKRLVIPVVIFVVLILGIYLLPYFIPLTNGRKAYIEQSIEDLIKFDINIKGKITFSILPTPTIILKNVDVAKQKSADDKENPKPFLTANQVFVNMDLFDLVKGNFKINKIIINKGIFNYSVYASTGFENLSLFLKGKNFNDLVIQDSSIIQYSQELNDVRRISNVDLHFKNYNDSQIKGTGSFNYLSSRVDNLSFYLKFIDNENYNLNVDFNYMNGRNTIISKFNIIVKDKNPIVNGSINLITDSLYKFAPIIDKTLSVPNIPLFNDKLNIKTMIQTTPDAIILSNGSFTSDNSYATFSGIIPFNKSENNEKIFDIATDNITFNIDFKNLKLEKLLILPENIFMDNPESDEGFKELLKFMSSANINATIKNLLIDDILLSNFEWVSKTLFENGKPSVLNIEKLSYKIGKNDMLVTGSVSDISNDINMDLSINDTIPFQYPNKFFDVLNIKSFVGKIIKQGNKISIPDFNIDISGNKIFGSFEQNIINGVPDYNLTLKSDSIDTSKFTKNDIDLPYIIYNLSLLKNTTFKFNAMIKLLKTPSHVYNLLKLDSSFKNDTLSVKKLNFANDGYTSNIKGDLIGITGKSGQFKNFNYVITSENLKGVSLPFVKNNFIDQIISNGVKQVDIKLNGDASNPTSDIYAVLNDIKVKVNGHLLEGSEKYTLDLSHSELKGFLFSWGIIDDTLMNYFYDNIPFSLHAEIDGDNVNNLTLTIKNNIFKGDITRKNISKNKKEKKLETSVNLQIDNLDVKSIIKRLKETDAYVDFMLKIIRSIPYNITLKANNIVEYNSNVYKDLYLKLMNAKNPGSFEFKIQKGNRILNLTSEILNNRIFTGTLNVKNYSLPSDFMNNELMN